MEYFYKGHFIGSSMLQYHDAKGGNTNLKRCLPLLLWALACPA